MWEREPCVELPWTRGDLSSDLSPVALHLTRWPPLSRVSVCTYMHDRLVLSWLSDPAYALKHKRPLVLR